MRRLLITFILLLVAGVILLPTILLFAISEPTPAAQAPPPVTPAVAREVKRIARQLKAGLDSPAPQTISLTEEGIAKLFAVAARAIPRLSGDARIRESDSEIRITLRLPENPFGHYINLRLGLPDASQGLAIGYLSAGSLTLHGTTAHALIERLANLAFGTDKGEQLLASIKQIRSSSAGLFITYQPIPHLDQQLAAAIEHLQFWRNKGESAETAAIRVYYMELCDQGYGTAPVSLGQPLSVTLNLAARRTTTAAEAVTEDRAALLALAIFFGTDRFNTFVNAIPAATIKQCQPRATPATLAGRQDLPLHFLYSAAIEILTDSHMSFAVGEMKEMMDSLMGGSGFSSIDLTGDPSGFSFIDLTADQSGIRMAELASTPESARRLQDAASTLTDEAHFFPSITGLPEGIPETQFEQHYGGSAGALYRQQLDEIKRRIAALTLYRSAQ